MPMMSRQSENHHVSEAGCPDAAGQIRQAEFLASENETLAREGDIFKDATNDKDGTCAGPAFELERKLALAALLTNDIKNRGLSQDHAALILGTQQSKVSKIMRGQVQTGISQAKLLEMLMKFGHDVTIVVDPAQPREGRVRLQVARQLR